MSEVTQEQRDAAAREFLGEDYYAPPGDASPSFAECTYGLAQDWLILTDEEADAATVENIRRDVWAFVPSFLLSYLPDGMTKETLSAMQEKLCEGATEPILAMLGDRFDEFADDAVSTDGRGHFLSGWDGTEHEFEHAGRTWYAYRN